MLPGLDPKKMQAVMKQMGIAQEEINASKVIIEKTDGNKLIINNPSVTKIKMQGQETLQIAGDIQEESAEPSITKEDIQTIVEKTGKSEEQARQALEETRDLAEAIMQLSE